MCLNLCEQDIRARDGDKLPLSELKVHDTAGDKAAVAGAGRCTNTRHTDALLILLLVGFRSCLMVIAGLRLLSTN